MMGFTVSVIKTQMKPDTNNSQETDFDSGLESHRSVWSSDILGTSSFQIQLQVEKEQRVRDDTGAGRTGDIFIL